MATNTTNASDIETLQTSVATNTTNIATNASDIDALQTSVATNTTNIATNASDIDALQTSVATNASDIETLQTSVATNTTNIATNASDIETLQTSVATNASDIDALNEHITVPFDGIVEDWANTSSGSSSSSVYTEVVVIDCIYFSTETNSFDMYTGGGIHVTSWDEDESSSDMYNDEDGVLHKDKVYFCRVDNRLYVWDDDAETLIVAKPEVIDNLTSTDTDVALSANQGKVLNEAIEANASDIDALETSVATNATNIATLTEALNNITSIEDEDIEALFE